MRTFDSVRMGIFVTVHGINSNYFIPNFQKINNLILVIQLIIQYNSFVNSSRVN